MKLNSIDKSDLPLWQPSGMHCCVQGALHWISWWLLWVKRFAHPFTKSTFPTGIKENPETIYPKRTQNVYSFQNSRPALSRDFKISSQEEYFISQNSKHEFVTYQSFTTIVICYKLY